MAIRGTLLIAICSLLIIVCSFFGGYLLGRTAFDPLGLGQISGSTQEVLDTNQGAIDNNQRAIDLIDQLRRARTR